MLSSLWTSPVIEVSFCKETGRGALFTCYILSFFFFTFFHAREKESGQRGKSAWGGIGARTCHRERARGGGIMRELAK